MHTQFDIYEAIARSHNDAHPDGPYVTSTEVRGELRRLLAIYGRFKRVQDVERDALRLYCCSFCGKSHLQVAGLIAGPGGVYICNECAAACNRIMNEGWHGND